VCSFEEKYGKNSRTEPHDKRSDDELQVCVSWHTSLAGFGKSGR
jgi:hypothetical protein